MCAPGSQVFQHPSPHSQERSTMIHKIHIISSHNCGAVLLIWGPKWLEQKKHNRAKKTYSSTTTPRATKECSKDAPGFYQPLNTQPDLPNLGLLLGLENLPDRDVANSLRFKTYPWPKQTINQPSMKPKPTLNYCNVRQPCPVLQAQLTQFDQPKAEQDVA